MLCVFVFTTKTYVSTVGKVYAYMQVSVHIFVDIVNIQDVL